jgi:transcriptional regulator with XRE-family HTH domain
MGPGVSGDLRRTVEAVAQCVIAVTPDRLRIAKAEGRPPRVEGSVMRYRMEAGVPALADAPMMTRLGAALRAVRSERGLTQTELAQMAGVSPSAISQAELGRRGLALETLLALTGKLGITLDDLIRGQVEAGYRLARRHDPPRRGDDRPLPLLDDPRAGLRAYLIRLQPGQSTTPTVVHTGVEMVAVASGLVQITVGAGLPVLREGEVLVVDQTRISGWRNMGEREALAFWILRDQARAEP